MRDNTGPLTELANLDKGCLAANGTPDSYNDQRASSLCVREPSTRARISERMRGEARPKIGAFAISLKDQ